MESSQCLTLKEKLQEYPEWDREEQIKRNSRALKKLDARRKETMNMSDGEAKAREEAFEEFKKIIDSNRPVGAKLYSEL